MKSLGIFAIATSGIDVGECRPSESKHHSVQAGCTLFSPGCRAGTWLKARSEGAARG